MGYVVAPAGFGKTHLIAQAVRHSTSRQLVLTHTYAGVNALRRKMRALAVPSAAYQIDTIASWGLRLSLSYRDASGWTIERPASDNEWADMYQACKALLEKDFIRRVVRASYVGVYVDEYQDCSLPQHGIVLKLARDLPCRILGDPMQAIFDFSGQPCIDWMRDVAANGELLGRLEIPYRWNLAGSPGIGVWLRNVRHSLEMNQPIDLSQGLPTGVTFKQSSDDEGLHRSQGNTCRYFQCRPHETVVAIHKGEQAYKSKCHVLAKLVSGRFSSIEEIEGKALFRFVKKIEKAQSNRQRLKVLGDFASKCMTSVGKSLSDATKRGEKVEIRVNTKNPEVAMWANAYLVCPSSTNMSGFLNALSAVHDVRVVRGDLYNRTLGVLRKHILLPEMTLFEATEKYHGEFRYKGRPVGRRKLIGTTLLVKGLEFDHGIVLDAACLSRNELYVALTRGARSLTILSTSSSLNPRH